MADLIKVTITPDGKFRIEGLDTGSKHVHEIEDELAELMGQVKASKRIRTPQQQEVVIQRR